MLAQHHMQIRLINDLSITYRDIPSTEGTGGGSAVHIQSHRRDGGRKCSTYSEPQKAQGEEVQYIFRATFWSSSERTSCEVLLKCGGCRFTCLIESLCCCWDAAIGHQSLTGRAWTTCVKCLIEDVMWEERFIFWERLIFFYQAVRRKRKRLTAKRVCNLIQVINGPTRVFTNSRGVISSTCTDHFYSNAVGLDSKAVSVPIGFRDHNLVAISRQTPVPKCGPKIVFNRSYKRFWDSHVDDVKVFLGLMWVKKRNLDTALDVEYLWNC